MFLWIRLQRNVGNEKYISPLGIVEKQIDTKLVSITLQNNKLLERMERKEIPTDIVEFLRTIVLVGENGKEERFVEEIDLA